MSSRETSLRVKALFTRFTALYGAKWTAGHEDPDVLKDKRALWTRALAKVTDEQLARGLAKLEGSDEQWPPTPPGRFVVMCLPTAEDRGFPDVRIAYRMATGADRRPMPAIVWATREEVGAFELRTNPEAKTFPVFQRTYEANVAAVLAGEKTFAYPEPAEPARRVEGPKRGPRPKTAAAEQGLAEAKAALGPRSFAEHARAAGFAAEE